MMGPFGFGRWWHLGFLGLGVRFLFFASAIVLIVYLMRNYPKNSVIQPQPRSPLEILKERYAGGEIDEETYEKMKRKIEES